MQLLQNNIGIFKCPACSGSMELKDNKSLVCSKGHCLDLSKNGYVNFLLHPVKTEYDKAMLSARNRILKSGFFFPLADQICKIATEEMDFSAKKQYRVFDAGCGEGSFLVQAVNCLMEDTATVKDGISSITGIGMDISKDGIQIAAKQYPNHIWCVGDLANCPFMDNKMDVIFSILSPSNYDEFRRLLTSGGLLIKAVPGSEYLKELREVFYNQTDKQEYSNERVLKHFKDNFDLIHTIQVRYSVDMNHDSLTDLIRMTPLSWSASQDKIQEALNSGIDSITVDMTVLCGK